MIKSTPSGISETAGKGSSSFPFPSLEKATTIDIDL
jgi:hypothetical protein